MPHHKKKFIKFPEYPGGKEEFRKYIEENLKYPDKALKNNIEGIVHLTATVDDNGNLGEARITKGLGFGCDEEALRLINGLKFGSVKNSGVRIKQQRRFRILFKIKSGATDSDSSKTESAIIFHYKTENKQSSESKPQGKVQTYSYTIMMG